MVCWVVVWWILGCLRLGLVLGVVGWLVYFGGWGVGSWEFGEALVGVWNFGVLCVLSGGLGGYLFVIWLVCGLLRISSFLG